MEAQEAGPRGDPYSQTSCIGTGPGKGLLPFKAFVKHFPSLCVTGQSLAGCALKIHKVCSRCRAAFARRRLVLGGVRLEVEEQRWT